MSGLPEYQKIASYDVDEESRLSSYPAVVAGDDAKRVVFSYNPIWPRPGTLQHVSGLLGADPTSTLSNIYTYFPNLSSIPPERISLRIPVLDDSTLAASILAQGNAGTNPNDRVGMVGAHPIRAGGQRGYQMGMTGIMAFEQWAEIRPEAWGTFRTDPPKRMSVVVADAPGESVKRTLRTFCFIMALILGPITVLIGFLGLMVYLDV